MPWYPSFNCTSGIQSNFEFKFQHVIFVKIPFNIKLSIYVKNVLTKFHENQGLVTHLLTCCKHMVLIHRNVKKYNNIVSV